MKTLAAALALAMAPEQVWRFQHKDAVLAEMVKLECKNPRPYCERYELKAEGKLVKAWEFELNPAPESTPQPQPLRLYQGGGVYTPTGHYMYPLAVP